MFRRSRKDRSPDPAAITFDRWCGDAEAEMLRLTLEAGDTDTFAAAYDRADAHRREFLVQVLTLDLPVVAGVDAWPSTEPGSALAHLVRGAQGISAAWEARGRDYADAVDDRAWGVFFDRLETAEVDLHRSAELADDGVVWSQLLVSGRGLQVTTDDLRERYSRAIALSPGLPYAADQLLQSLCAKWRGSHDEMFEFARAVGADSADGDPRHRLIAVAHVERGIEFRTTSRGAIGTERMPPRTPRSSPPPSGRSSPRTSGRPPSTSSPSTASRSRSGTSDGSRRRAPCWSASATPPRCSRGATSGRARQRSSTTTAGSPGSPRSARCQVRRRTRSFPGAVGRSAREPPPHPEQRPAVTGTGWAVSWGARATTRGGRDVQDATHPPDRDHRPVRVPGEAVQPEDAR